MNVYRLTSSEFLYLIIFPKVSFFIMKKFYILTFFTELLVLVSTFCTYKFTIIFLRPESFSEYILSRRILSFLQPFLLLGMGIAIPRFVAYEHAKNRFKKRDSYFISALSILTCVSIIFLLTLNFFKSKIAFLLYGNSNYYNFLNAIFIMLIGLVLHISCYSYLRGKLNMIKANILQLITMGIIPPFAFIGSSTTLEVLYKTGIGWCFLSFVTVFVILRQLHWNKNDFFNSTKQILLYGIQRVPGAIGLSALFTLPATFTAHLSGIREAGFVAFGISVLTLLRTIFAPAGLILLPKISQLAAQKNYSLLKAYIKNTLKVTILLTLIIVIILEIFAKQILILYLGQNFPELIFIFRTIVIGSFAYSIYISMRSFIDAIHIKAINTLNIIVSLLIFLILSISTLVFAKNYLYILFYFLITLFFLGFLTLLQLRKIYRGNVDNKH